MLLLILLIFLISDGEALSCPPPPTAGLFACQNRSLREVPLPIGAPAKSRLGITALDVSSNSIEILHEDALRPYPSLLTFRAERNLLWKITDMAFRTVPRLEGLFLRGNRLAIQPGSLSPKALLQLKHLKQLDLSGNPVATLPQGFFVPSLVEIHLERTVRSLAFHRHAFSNLTSLRVLNLANNQFETLPPHLEGEIMTDLSELKHLHLYGNAWNCDCHLAWLARVARRFNETPLCARPPAVANRILPDLPLHEFQCAPAALHKQAGIPAERINEAETGSTIHLTCTFHSEPRGRITWFHDERVLQKSATREAVVGPALVQTNLTLTDVQVGLHDGLYRCEAENARGKDEITFPIKIGYPRGGGGRFHVSRLLFGLILGGGGFLLSLSVVSILLYCYQRDKGAREAAQREAAVVAMKSESAVQPPVWTQNTWPPQDTAVAYSPGMETVLSFASHLCQADVILEPSS